MDLKYASSPRSINSHSPYTQTLIYVRVGRKAAERLMVLDLMHTVMSDRDLLAVSLLELKKRFDRVSLETEATTTA